MPEFPPPLTLAFRTKPIRPNPLGQSGQVQLAAAREATPTPRHCDLDELRSSGDHPAWSGALLWRQSPIPLSHERAPLSGVREEGLAHRTARLIQHLRELPAGRFSAAVPPLVRSAALEVVARESTEREATGESTLEPRPVSRRSVPWNRPCRDHREHLLASLSVRDRCRCAAGRIAGVIHGA